jgi:hypothetical protein
MEDTTLCLQISPGRVVDILGASGASDPGSNPGRGVLNFIHSSVNNLMRDFLNNILIIRRPPPWILVDWDMDNPGNFRGGNELLILWTSVPGR